MKSRKHAPPAKAVPSVKGAGKSSRMGTSRVAVKRSVTVRSDLHDAIIDSVGARGYSAFLNEALVMALQARGIEDSVAEFERAHGALSPADLSAADRRRAEAALDARR